MLEAGVLHVLLNSFGIPIVILLVMEVNYQFIATVVRVAHFIDVMMATYVLTEIQIKVFSLKTHSYQTLFCIFDDLMKKK